LCVVAAGAAHHGQYCDFLQLPDLASHIHQSGRANLDERGAEFLGGVLEFVTAEIFKGAVVRSSDESSIGPKDVIVSAEYRSFID
jgi:hypothetical protein